MSLTKTSSTGPAQDVVQLITPDSDDKVQMSISADGMGHILARLTDLYTDPVKAATREVISNAIDATVRLPENEREPVQIFMPTNLRSALVVRDFGTGMSEEIVRKIYSQYGASTKRDDMRQIGAYGLGAKAPLAYCSEFLVVTTCEGITTEFTVSRTPEGNFVKITSVQPTDKPRGTTVTIPVKMHDADDFRKALESYKNYSFDVPISIDGVVPDSPEFLLIESNFVIHRDEETGEETTGRVWVRRDSLIEYFEQKYKSSSRSSDNFRFAYVLSGWAYAPPVQRGGYFRGEPSVIFELKPGVVDFSSSRDEITNNDRSRLLDKTALDYIRSTDHKSIENLLKLYRKFSREDAERFFMAALWNGELKNRTFVLPSTPDPVILTVEDLVTDKGYSPLAPLVASYKANLRAAFMLPYDSKEQRVLNMKAFEESVDLFSLRGSLFPSSTVARGNELLQGAFGTNKAVLSVADTVLQYYAQIKARIAPNNMQKIVVISDADSVTLKRLMGYRKLLAENDYSNTVFIFAYEGKDLQAQLKVVQNYTGVKPEVRTMESLIDYCKEIRKEARSESSSAGAATFSVTLLDATDITEEKKVVEESRGRYLGHHSITVETLKNEGALLVLTKNNAASVLVGAANAGVNIVGRKIYITGAYHGMRATHFKDLEAYGDYVVSPDFFHKGKQAEAVIEKNRHSGRVLHSALRSADKNDIYKSVIQRFYIERAFFTGMLAHVKKNHPRNKELIAFLDYGTNFNRYSGASLGSLSDDELKHALTPKEYKIVTGFNKAHEATRDHSSFQAKCMAELFQFGGTDYGQFGSQIMEELYSWIVDGSPEIEDED